mgnify:CR=1 FL=1
MMTLKMNDPDMELTIRGSEDKDSRLTETEPQTISIAEEDIIEDENQDNEASEFRVEVPSTTQGCTEFPTMGCRGNSAPPASPQNISEEQKKSTVCWYCGKYFDTSQFYTLSCRVIDS